MRNYNNRHRLLCALRANLLTVSALFLCAGLRVEADGGAGGSTNLTVPGGAGGSGVNGQPGSNGQNNPPNDGTGGGGGGAGGGAGGNGADGGSGGGTGGLGGAGGTSVSPNGQDAPAAPINVIIGSTAGGGGGGGGGYNGNGPGAAKISNTISVSGGNGGAGANGGMSDPTATNPTGGGGGGGAGGMGLIILGSTSNTNTGTVAGGNGGTGGDGGGGSDFGSAGGSGGDGGVGMLFRAPGATLINSGTISGGNGGAAGITAPSNPGLGGVGVSGGGLTITNSGTISGGLDGVGNQANAIEFTSGVNRLTLLPGSAVTGNVIAFSTADSLILGGSTNGTFDVSQIGASAQYQGFGIYQKVGTGTWTLTNTTTAVTPWTISAGTLAISQDGSLGDSSGALTLDGGTLETTAAFSSSRNISLLAGGGTLQTDANLTLSGTLSNGGNLTKTGSGTLMLTGNNINYSGNTTISAGTIEANGSNALGTGLVAVSPGASLQVSSFGFHNDLTISGTGAGGAGAIFSTGSVNNLFGHITLAGDATVNKGDDGFAMFFNGPIDLSAHDLTLGGGGAFAIENQVVGTGGITLAPNSTLLLGGAVDTYTGLTAVEAGSTLFLEKSNGITAVPGDLSIAGTVVDARSGQLAATTVVTLTGNGQFLFARPNTTETFAGLVSTSGTTSVGPESSGGGNTITLGGAGTYDYSGMINDFSAPTKVMTIVKQGSGSQEFDGANTYSGGTTISTGILIAGNSSALGTGDVNVTPGGTLQLNGGIDLANNITISGTGASGAGAIFADYGSYEILDGNFAPYISTISGTVSLAGNATINASNFGFGTFNVDGNVNLNGNELSIVGSQFSRGVGFNGQVTGTGGITLENGGLLQLDGATANTFTGPVMVQAGGLLFLSVNGTAVPGDLSIAGEVVESGSDQLAATTVITLSGNGVLTLDPPNRTETVAGLAGISALTTIESFPGPERGSPNGPVQEHTLTLDGTGIYSYAGRIIDNLYHVRFVYSTIAIVKQGSGSQEFDGANDYSGGTTLNAGTLIAGNSAAFGTGLLTVSGGTLMTGNNNHLISVGSYAQTGGTFLLFVNGRGRTATADQLNVTNMIGITPVQSVLGGNLTVNLAGLLPALGPATTYSFNLVDTNDGYTGTFAFNTLNLANGLTASLDYAGDDVLLQIAQGANFFAVTGLTPNQQAIVGSINPGLLAGNGSPNFTVLVNGLAPFSSNPAALGGALNELSPQAFGQFTSVTAFNNASFGTEANDQYAAGQRIGPNGTFIGGNGNIDASGLTLNDPSYDPTLAMLHSRLMAWNAGPLANGLLSDSTNPLLGGVEMKDTKEMVAPVVNDPWNFFVRGNVILAQGFSDPDVAHFDDNTASVGIGADYRITPNLLVGLSAGYGHTDVTLDPNGSSATVDSYSPGIYASYANHGWYANLSGDYVHNTYTQSRVISFLSQTATSAPEGNEGVANLDGGYDFHKGALTIGPLAGLQYTHLAVDGYTESGSVADLSVNEQDADSLRSRLGGRLSYALVHGGVTFTPHLDASWQHEFMDQSRGITSQFSGAGLGSFSVKTDNPSRDSALVDVGLDAQINQTITVFGDYAVQAGQSNYFGQSVQAGVKIGF